MNREVKQFHAETEAKKTFAVRVVHVWGVEAGHMKVLDANVTTGGMFVHWPLAGTIRVLAKSGRLGATNTRLGLWRVHSDDFKEMRRRRVILQDRAAEFLPLASARPVP